jgi:hypothetical protein
VEKNMKSSTIAAFALGTAIFAAPIDAIAAPRRTTFALVVGNNSSPPELGRQELKYADDDGVRYAEVFAMIAPPENVHLLTELDRDSANLFPQWKGQTTPPNKANVNATAKEIADAAQKARDQGDEVDFYFVFAGHGNVDRGQGYLQLSDARFDTDNIAALLKSIPATHTHVILDSCNSVFALTGRKAGGRRVALADDVRKILSKQLPNVGVFLSTSAEAIVYESSALQSGVFSHAVRSGLLGGADADHNGNITYDELSAFVGIAARNVVNPQYRPSVFANGPSGRNNESVFSVKRAKGPQITLKPAPRMRLTVSDATGLPWIDVHKEEGAEFTLHLPQRLAKQAFVVESEVHADGSLQKLQSYEFANLPDNAHRDLADATPSPLLASARGPDESLRMLFAAPFGPRAMSAYKLEKREEPIYGVSLEDVERMRLLLAQVSLYQRNMRWISGGAVTALGGLYVAGGAGMQRAYPTDKAAERTGRYYMLQGGVLAAGGLASWLIPRAGEKLHNNFVRDLRTRGLAGALPLVARAEEKLFDLAEEYRSSRGFGGILGGLFLAASTGGFIATAADDNIRDRFPLYTGFGIGAIAGAGYILWNLMPTPIERMAELWRNDPGRLQLEMPSFSITPTIGLGHIGVQGTF